MLSLEKSVPLLGLAPCADISSLLTNASPLSTTAIGLDSNMYIVLSGCATVPGLPCVGLPGGTLCCACRYCLNISICCMQSIVA
ncbi:hypothetical protein LSH36_105g01006 [Paralvinella palmiformis]|uniref:Uncharacterized protein n=1 Tax=Paralvinella palmiformis TaxID=53620 RepID=A0AAD9JZS0_9ANNE|nr:hypothetical protein LSH36_105g01006 [Paralvinella palmiformis]